jgi:hypothetical protein
MDIGADAPIMVRTLLILLLFEVVVVLVAPLMIPNARYLSWYLSDRAKEATQQFLQGEGILIPDEDTGWKNRPDVSKGNWIIDSNGSRSTHTFTNQRTKPIRALFLGSSMINGGTDISNDESLSAYSEDEKIEALNFGTMMYAFDQVLLAYRSELHNYDADVLVIGLDADPTAGLMNHYLPFRFRKEANMPFVKPRFVLDSGLLKEVKISPEVMLRDVPDSPALIDFLADNDSFYFNFESYRHMGFLPLSAGIRTLWIRAEKFLDYFRSDSEGQLILNALMEEMVREAGKHNTEVVFVMLPDHQIFTGGGLYRFAPDNYERRCEQLRSSGFDVIDARRILRESAKPASELFYVDQVHFTAAANRLIGQSLRPIIRAKAGKT